MLSERSVNGKNMFFTLITRTAQDTHTVSFSSSSIHDKVYIIIWMKGGRNSLAVKFTATHMERFCFPFSSPPHPHSPLSLSLCDFVFQTVQTKDVWFNISIKQSVILLCLFAVHSCFSLPCGMVQMMPILLLSL